MQGQRTVLKSRGVKMSSDSSDHRFHENFCYTLALNCISSPLSPESRYEIGLYVCVFLIIWQWPKHNSVSCLAVGLCRTRRRGAYTRSQTPKCIQGTEGRGLQVERRGERRRKWNINSSRFGAFAHKKCIIFVILYVFVLTKKHDIKKHKKHKKHVF